MRRAGILVSAAVCILLPMVLGAPASDDSLLKQQVCSEFPLQLTYHSYIPNIYEIG